MDRVGFRAYLADMGASEEAIALAFAMAERFERYARDTLAIPVDQMPSDAVQAFASELIEQGDNTHDNYLALLRFGRFARNNTMVVAMLDVLGGHGVLRKLHGKVGVELGDPARDRIFAGIELPPLGMADNRERARRMQKVVERLEATAGHAVSRRLLGQGLEDLRDEGFAGERRLYEESSGIDEYLRDKGDRFIAELKRIRDEGTLYYTQPVTDEVIAYVEAHPEIRQGVRVGDVLYEAKIPYMAAEYLRETDPQLKAYQYCHCPWARESLRRGEKTVSRVFCNCSAAFHRKPYEVIFGRELETEVLETVLAGDPWCKFAIHLPEGVA